jgi:hypothetical protein
MIEVNKKKKGNMKKNKKKIKKKQIKNKSFSMKQFNNFYMQELINNFREVAKKNPDKDEKYDDLKQIFLQKKSNQ